MEGWGNVDDWMMGFGELVRDRIFKIGHRYGSLF